ncbi:MAG: inositol monophosphatase [Magnetococcales bacterium]|nr:inositol monophosphatase [Magnetococcales bacterium]NGZ28301.1 inositol monophosphatase [Magnetococcales bacterium]
MNQSPVLNVIVRAVRKAGQTALRHFDFRHQLEVKQKGRNDPVSNADTDVERELLYHLNKAYPTYGVLAEEGGETGSSEAGQWIIDPIDGTTNFLHGIPHFAVSVALLLEGEIQVGVVYNPVTDELFSAEKGRGAFLNDRRIRVRDNRNLSQSLLATGFPSRNPDALEGFLASLRKFLLLTEGVRRDGSAALDLAYTAAGRFDGYWESRIHPWDVAAGSLLVQEAGGFVSDFQGGRNFLYSGAILAANPILHGRMLEVLREVGLA